MALESKVDALEEEKTAFHLRADGAVEEKANLAAQLADATSQLKCQEEECDSLQAKLAGAEENYGKQRDGFVEELNKMNDVLKQRGETITRLEEKCQTSEKEFKVSLNQNLTCDAQLVTFSCYAGENRDPSPISCRKGEEDRAAGDAK